MGLHGMFTKTNTCESLARCNSEIIFDKAYDKQYGTLVQINWSWHFLGTNGHPNYNI